MAGSGTVEAGGVCVTSKRKPVPAVGMSIEMDPSGVAAPLDSEEDQELKNDLRKGEKPGRPFTDAET